MPSMYDMINWEISGTSPIDMKSGTNMSRGDIERPEDSEDEFSAEKYGTCQYCGEPLDRCRECECDYEDGNWKFRPPWKITGQESYGDGYIVTHYYWPNDRLIVMKDTEGNKPILVPVFDTRNVANSESELIQMLIDDNKKQVHGNLKYIYVFTIEGYEHLFGMVALSRESKPVTDFFKDVRAPQECTESQFRSY